jgi:prevent-host-death family protein
MADGTWSVAEAKAKFSEIVERARTQGPQRVTRNGKDAVMVVATEDWFKRDRPPETVYDFLARSPLRGSGIDLERIRGGIRDIDF